MKSGVTRRVTGISRLPNQRLIDEIFPKPKIYIQKSFFS